MHSWCSLIPIRRRQFLPPRCDRERRGALQGHRNRRPGCRRHCPEEFADPGHHRRRDQSDISRQRVPQGHRRPDEAARRSRYVSGSASRKRPVPDVRAVDRINSGQGPDRSCRATNTPGRPRPAVLCSHSSIGRHGTSKPEAFRLPEIRSTPYPFEDCWPFVRALVDAFTLDHCMWASDWPYLRAQERQDYGPLVQLAAAVPKRP